MKKIDFSFIHAFTQIVAMREAVNTARSIVKPSIHLPTPSNPGCASLPPPLSIFSYLPDLLLFLCVLSHANLLNHPKFLNVLLSPHSSQFTYYSCTTYREPCLSDPGLNSWARESVCPNVGQESTRSLSSQLS